MANILFIFAISQSLEYGSANVITNDFQEPLLVKRCNEFNITGKGDNS